MAWKKVKLGDVLIKKNLRLKDVPNLKDPIVLGVANDKGVVKSKVEPGQKIEEYYVIEKGDFIYNPYRINVGSIGISELDGITSLAYVVFRVDETRLNKYLLFKFLKSEFGIKEIIKNSRGSVRNALRFEDLAKIELTLPTIEIQNRLVENFKQKEVKVELLKSNFAHQLTLISQLEQTILQEAVQGKLVPQDPNDEPASELLKRIKAERQKSLPAGAKRRQEKPLPPIKPEEIPFDIPENWVWCRLGEIISISSGDGLTSYQMDKSGNIPVYGGNGINGYHSKFNIDSKRIVIGRVGAYCGAVHITEDKGWVTDNAFIVSYSVENIDFNWLAFFLKALDLNKLSYKGNQPVISGARVYPLVVPLPPLSEQKRIVAEIEKQFALTKQLKEHIIANQQATEQLLKALLHQAFEVKEMEEVNS